MLVCQFRHVPGTFQVLDLNRSGELPVDYIKIRRTDCRSLPISCRRSAFHRVGRSDTEHLFLYKTQRTLRWAGSFGLVREKMCLRQRTIDCAIRTPKLGTERPYDRNDDQGNKRKNDCIFNKTLTVFFWRKQHGTPPFLKN